MELFLNVSVFFVCLLLFLVMAAASFFSPLPIAPDTDRLHRIAAKATYFWQRAAGPWRFVAWAWPFVVFFANSAWGGILLLAAALISFRYKTLLSQAVVMREGRDPTTGLPIGSHGGQMPAQSNVEPR